MEIAVFNFTTEYKQASALGMSGYKFFYGSIDGVEVGSPCDSESESLADVENILTREKPFALEEWLQDEVESYEGILRSSKYAPSTEQLRVGLQKRRQLLNKVLAFKAANNH